MVESKALECKGPNDGVENTEVMQVVHDTLVSFGLSSDDVHFFVTDGDGVVGAAVSKLLAFYPLALPIVCGSHSLNNCGKAMLSAPGLDDVKTIWNDARDFLQPKKQSARRRRWFALLNSKREGAQCSSKMV